ncbi:MAG: redox-regulated ATPase YchF [Candidatus Aenigmatarchaeota archaeon]
MEIGLIGKPSSGKSSFFKAATMIDVPIDERPFTTIKPNVGIAYVTVECVEKEFNLKCQPRYGKCENGIRYIPVKIWDIAGLVPNAHEGRGLGLKFLDDIRQASVLIHIVDVSGKTDEEGRPTHDHDPVKDVEFVEKEIDEWFKGIIEKVVEKYKSKIKSEKMDISQLLFEQLSGLGVKKIHIDKCMEYFDFDNIEKFSTNLRKISKPMLIAANKIDIDDAERNFRKLKEKFDDHIIIPVSALFEIALKTAHEKGLIKYDGKNFEIKSDLTPKQKECLDMIKEKVIEKYGSTGVQECINKAVFDLLKKIVVYPVADANKLTDNKKNVLPDAYLIDEETLLKDFAYILHSDIGKNFICGIDARSKKKLSADYKLKNNDIIEIMFNKR